MKSALNQKSQMSEVFGAALVKGSIENPGQPNEFIRGVPKFIDQTNNRGLRYATGEEMQNFDLTGQGSLYDSAFLAAQLNKLGPSMGYPNTNETLCEED